MQTKYIKILLRRFGLEDCKPTATPKGTCLHISIHDPKHYYDVMLYMECLNYVCITRPDIQYAVSQVSRFMHSPGTKHWQVVKHIFCLQHLASFYPKGGTLVPCFFRFGLDWFLQHMSVH